MKKIILIIFSVFLAFSFISCAMLKQNVNATIPITTSATTGTTSIPSATVPITINTSDLSAETTIEVTPETTISDQQALDNYKTALKKHLKDGFGAELTKFVWDQDNRLITIAYDTKLAVKETRLEELYNITKGLTDNGGWIFNADLDLTSTSQLGDTLKAHTTNENMMKIADLEMSYKDWLKVAFK
jgi:hypothetical protein